MYSGVVVEDADVHTLFAKPLHPYTAGLLTSVPRMDTCAEKRARLSTIPGIVPNLLDLPAGCRFSDRCLHVSDRCKKCEPPLEKVEEGHFVRCWQYLPAPKE